MSCEWLVQASMQAACVCEDNDMLAGTCAADNGAGDLTASGHSLRHLIQLCIDTVP